MRTWPKIFTAVTILIGFQNVARAQNIDEYIDQIVKAEAYGKLEQLIQGGEIIHRNGTSSNGPIIHDLDAGYSEDLPFILDLANNDSIPIISDYEGKFFIRVINMVANNRVGYTIKLDSKTIEPKPFDRPTSNNNANTNANANPIVNIGQQELAIDWQSFGLDLQDQLPSMAEMANLINIELEKLKKDHCDNFHQAYTKIFNATDEKTVKKSLNAFLTLVGENNYQFCEDYESKISSAIHATEKSFYFNVKKNKKYTLKISRNDSNVSREISISGPSKDWKTHFGFSFINNKNKEYFSQEIPGTNMGDPSTYTLAAQNKKKKHTQHTQALFTYPLKSYDDLDFGITAGLGSNSKSVQVYAGVSLIIRENLLISTGVTYQEFTVLSGTYEVGQDLGGSPVDSKNLTESTYKPAFSLVIGFKFGDQQK